MLQKIVEKFRSCHTHAPRKQVGLRRINAVDIENAGELRIGEGEAAGEGLVFVDDHRANDSEELGDRHSGECLELGGWVGLVRWFVEESASRLLVVRNGDLLSIPPSFISISVYLMARHFPFLNRSSMHSLTQKSGAPHPITEPMMRLFSRVI